ALAYVIIRITISFVISDYEWAERVAGWGGEPSVDPRIPAMFFMMESTLTLCIGLIIFVIPSPSELGGRGKDDDGSGGSSAMLATTTALTTITLTSMR